MYNKCLSLLLVHRPPFELVECGEEPTMGFEQPKSDRQQSILESILEKPKTTGRNTNRTPSEKKKRKRKDDRTVRTSNGDITGQDGNTKTQSSVDITQLRKEVQEVLNKKLCVDQQSDVGASSSSSEQFAEVLIKEEVTLIDAPMTRDVFGEEGELPLVEIKQETLVFGDECNPLGTSDIQES